jgi:hypothetical protein
MFSKDSKGLEVPRRFPVLSLLASLPFLAGCMSMEVPQEFLVIESGSSELKALSADDAKIWVKQFSDSHQGDLSFWSDALKNDLVDNRGYTLLEEGTATDGTGTEGVEYLFEATLSGRAQRYLLFLFVHPGWMSNTICTVEYVASKEIFDEHLAKVRESVKTLEP